MAIDAATKDVVAEVLAVQMVRLKAERIIFPAIAEGIWYPARSQYLPLVIEGFLIPWRKRLAAATFTYADKQISDALSYQNFKPWYPDMLALLVAIGP
jgi:hypothetical protein